MQAIEAYRHYLIVESEGLFGIFDPALNMIIDFEKSIKKAEEEIDEMETL
jgi:hypothetical protein